MGLGCDPHQRVAAPYRFWACPGGHEIVFVFAARLRDRSLYDLGEIPTNEIGWGGFLLWEPLSRFERGERPLYPVGLLELLLRNTNDRKMTAGPLDL